jgi:hypothetical protein
VLAPAAERIAHPLSHIRPCGAWARLVSNQRPLACEAAGLKSSETASTSGVGPYLAGEHALWITRDSARSPGIRAERTVSAQAEYAFLASDDSLVGVAGRAASPQKAPAVFGVPRPVGPS